MTEETLFQVNIVDEDDNVETIKWLDVDQAEAMKRGWFIDIGDGAICRDDEADYEVFESNAQAQERVRSLATAGDERCIRAMILDLTAAREAWMQRRDEVLTKKAKAELVAAEMMSPKPWKNDDAIEQLASSSPVIQAPVVDMVEQSPMHAAGYYWVRDRRKNRSHETFIAEWHNGCWFVPGNEVEFDDEELEVLGGRLHEPAVTP